MSSPTLSNLCRFLPVIFVVVTVSCCCSCCSSSIMHPQLQMNNKKITQQQQQQGHTDKSTEIVQYLCGNLSFDYCCYCVMLLLWFICSCTCTMTIKGQQHETVTATTTTQSNLHKLLSVQELIFPIQQLNVNSSSENMSSFSSVHIIWRWANSDLGHQMSLPGGVHLISVCTSSENLT